MAFREGALDIYSLPAVTHARATLEKYRGKIEYGVGRMQVLAEIGGASYLAARLSAQLGGPEGKTIVGLPIELAIGAACGALAMTGSAGKHAEDVLALGVGAIAAYTSRLGFEAGLANAKPPAEPAGQVAGAAPVYYYIPQPPPVLPAPRAGHERSEYERHAEQAAGVGANEIEAAVEVLDRLHGNK